MNELWIKSLRGIVSGYDDVASVVYVMLSNDAVEYLHKMQRVFDGIRNNVDVYAVECSVPFPVWWGHPATNEGQDNLDAQDWVIVPANYTMRRTPVATMTMLLGRHGIQLLAEHNDIKHYLCSPYLSWEAIGGLSGDSNSL